VGKDKPSGRKEDVTAGSLIGKHESLTSLATQYPVALGKLPQDVLFVKEVEKALGNSDQVPDGAALLEEYQKWTAMDPDAPDQALSVPLPARKLLEVEKEIEALREVRERVALGPAALPSICCYTFHNTRDGLNSLDMSDDGMLIAGGFSDSYLKIWNLSSSADDEQQQRPALPSKNTRHDMKTDQPLPNASVKLVGHSGPVYSSSFGPDNRYLISASEDKTARLWSMDTFKNLVVYKGHNYPIWDVDVGPYGLYFATASHDRTARLWSTDHVYALRIFVGHLSDVDVSFFFSFFLRTH
jgi:transcription initiation factor TFIID subunit 5